MAKGIKRQIRIAIKNIGDDIRAYIKDSGNNIFARGMSSEGYNGGYRDALRDVLLILEGHNPSDRHRSWWIKKDDK